MLCAYSIGAPIVAGQISREKHNDSFLKLFLILIFIEIHCRIWWNEKGITIVGRKEINGTDHMEHYHCIACHQQLMSYYSLMS